MKLKFRTPHYNIRTNEFSHFTYWGRINHKFEIAEGCFVSPSNNNQSIVKEDEYKAALKQLTGGLEWFTDKSPLFEAIMTGFVTMGPKYRYPCIVNVIALEN